MTDTPKTNAPFRLGRTHTMILDEMVEAGEITPEEAAEAWKEAHADDDYDE